MRVEKLLTLVRAGIQRRMLAIGAGTAGAFVLCLAIPGALGALGCFELGNFGICLGANGGEAGLIQPVVLVAVAVLATSFSAAVAVEGVRQSRLAGALGALARPTSVMGQKVGLVDELSGAVVAGVARPAIYCSPSLIAGLEGDELRAVLLHERHHQRTWAPLRLVILSAAGRFIDWSAAGRRWLHRRRAAIEIAADAYVLSAGLPRPVLARAIVKLYDAHAGMAAARFANAADLRLQALLAQQEVVPDEPTRTLPVAALIAFLVACIALS